LETNLDSSTRRPGVVSFVGIVLYAQAFMAAIAAISMLIWRNDVADFLKEQGSPLTSAGALTGTIIGEALIAVLLFFVARGIMGGSKGFRLYVALTQCFAMGVAIYTLVAHHVGGYVYRGVFTLFVGVFVLWALYGNEESDRYFETNG